MHAGHFISRRSHSLWLPELDHDQDYDHHHDHAILPSTQLGLLIRDIRKRLPDLRHDPSRPSFVSLELLRNISMRGESRLAAAK